VSASRDSLRTIIGLAAAALEAGEDTGVFAAEDKAEAAAADPGTLVQAEPPLILPAEPAPMTAMVSGVSITLYPDQAELVKNAYPAAVAALQTAAAALGTGT